LPEIDYWGEPTAASEGKREEEIREEIPFMNIISGWRDYKRFRVHVIFLRKGRRGCCSLLSDFI